jgi:hypothetical protein
MVPAASRSRGHALRNEFQPSADSSDCRLRGDWGLSRTGCWVSRTSSACQRATSPNQNALSLALLASTARRRHSSARLRKCSMLTCLLPADRSLPSSVGNITTVIQSSGDKRLNFSRGFAQSFLRCNNPFARRPGQALPGGRGKHLFSATFLYLARSALGQTHARPMAGKNAIRASKAKSAGSPRRNPSVIERLHRSA